jgi:hypothetical protein
LTNFTVLKQEFQNDFKSIHIVPSNSVSKRIPTVISS